MNLTKQIHKLKSNIDSHDCHLPDSCQCTKAKDDLIKYEMRQELLYSPAQAHSLLKDFLNELEDNRFFTYEDVDNDIVKSLLYTLDKVKKVAGSLEDEINQQVGNKYSDKYKD